MNNYTIFTDSGCDVTAEILEKWGIKCIDLTFRFQNEDRELTCRDMPVKDFYDRMRDGQVAFTSAANIDVFLSVFEPELKAGRDVLYLAFSSGLSGTANNARIAVEELKESYPDRTIIAVDTLCASAGQGLMVYLAAKKAEGGASIEEVAEYAEQCVPQLCHWFTVDDLVYLKRGGRVNAASAFAATVLNIKPVLHVDDEGHLISMAKVRGRKAAVQMMANKLFETANDLENGIYFISHGDCAADAEMLEKIISEKCGHKAELITDIGPVIGAHSGPGTLALFFLGSKR